MAITKITTPELFDFSATNTALQLPTGDTASRPASPSTGEWRYNTTLKYVEFYDGANWFRIDTEAIPAPNPVGNENFNVSTYFGNAATQTLDAKFNEAANLNGSSSKIDLPNFMPSGNAARTVSMWIKTTQTTAATLFKYGGANTNLLFDFRINDGGTDGGANTIGVGFYGSANDFNRPATTLMNGNWHNVVTTYDGTDGKIYIDGVQTGTTKTLSGTANTTATTALIGSDGGSFLFNGSIDQVRVYNTALTDAQAEDLYTDETTTTAATLDFPVGAGCIAAYQLDGNGNDISTNYNSTSTTDIGYTGLKFKPDFVWIKQKSGGASHSLQNTILGVGADYTLYTDDSVAMGAYNVYGYLSGFDANGFTVVNQNGNHTNAASSPYVAWSWKAGGAPDAINGNTPETPPTLGSVMIDGVKSTANLNGSIAAKKISANTDAGFSIVEHLGSGANATVAHGLSSILELIIYKQYNDVGSGKNWVVYAKTLGDTKNIIMNLTSTGGTDPDSWNDTSPTDTVFSLGPGSNSYGSQTNVSGKLNIAYCFHSVPGYSKIGSYLWSATSYTAGVMVNDLGFTPRFVMIKGTTVISNWYIFDNTRGATGAYVYQYPLFPDDAAAQDTTGFQCIQFNSNGFSAMVWRASPLPNTTGSSGLNEENQTYLYFAVA